MVNPYIRTRTVRNNPFCNITGIIIGIFILIDCRSAAVVFQNLGELPQTVISVGLIGIIW